MRYVVSPYCTPDGEPCTREEAEALNESGEHVVGVDEYASHMDGARWNISTRYIMHNHGRATPMVWETMIQYTNPRGGSVRYPASWDRLRRYSSREMAAVGHRAALSLAQSETRVAEHFHVALESMLEDAASGGGAA